MTNKTAITHYLALVAGILCIAWSAIFVKLANVPGIPSAFYRMLFATLGVIPIWYFYNRGKQRDLLKVNRKVFLMAILGGAFFGIDLSLWNTSILLSKAAIATLLANLAPLWVGLGAIYIFKDKPSPIFWVGTAISIVGVLMIVGVNTLTNSSLNLGSMLAISASFFYAAYLLTTQQIRTQMDTISFTTVSMASSTLVLFLFSIVGDFQLTGYSTHSWLSLAGMGLISQLSGWLLINYALGYIKSTIASVSLLSQSVFTALLSIPVLHETLDLGEILGAIVVLAGIFLVNMFKKK